jgi:hypothetical protein
MPITVGVTEPARRKRIRVAAFIPSAMAYLVLVGCASNSATPAPPSSPTYSVQLCSEAAEYQTAANTVVTLDATNAGTDDIKKAVLDLQTATNNLIAAAAAENQFGPQLGELEKASASLNSTITGLSSQDSPSTNLDKIAAPVSAVEQAATPIMDSVRTGCPSVPSAATPPTS